MHRPVHPLLRASLVSLLIAREDGKATLAFAAFLVPVFWLSVRSVVSIAFSIAMTTSCGHQPSACPVSANSPQSSTIVTLHRLEVPPLSSLFPSEYRDWGLCGTCGVQTHEVFLRRDGSSSVTATPKNARSTTTTTTGTTGDESSADDDSTEERVQLPITIPGKIQLGRCLKCRPRRKKQHNNKASTSGNKSRTNSTRRSTGRRRNLNEVNEEEPGTDDEVSDKSLFPDLLAGNDENENEEDANEPRNKWKADAANTNTETTSGGSSVTTDNDHDDHDDDASTVITAITTSPALLSTPHPLTKTISHISHISHGSEPSQGNQSLQTESSESSEETLWSIESGESEDSLLRRVVSFAANTTTATYTTNGMRSDAAATFNDNIPPPSPPRSALRYKRRTEDHESIGTSIATSLVSSHASFSSNSSSSSEEDGCSSSDEDTIVSGNRSPGRFDAKRKSTLKKKLASGPPMPLSGAQRVRSAPAAVPGKLAREWNHEEDNFGSYLTSRGKRNISLPTNVDFGGGLERHGSTGTSGAQTSDQCRPKWTARSAILTHEEELQAMLQQQCSRKNANAETNDDGDESTIDSTSGDIGCMAARLRKQYGIHRISFASSGASTTSSSTDSSMSASNCSGDSGKAPSLLSGITASTATDSSHADGASSSSSSSSRWMTQSQEAEKKSWNRKVTGFFAADKILGRNR